MNYGQGATTFFTLPNATGGGPPFQLNSAVNGLSVDTVTGKIVFGNNVGQVGSPAQLLSNRQIAMKGFSIDLLGNAGDLKFNDDGSIIFDNNLDEPYFVANRGVNLGFPVSIIRPQGNNLKMAFDIMPNGAAVPDSNGYAWIDVCDTDCFQSQPPIVAARLGANVAAMEVGMKSFNLAAEKAFNIVMNSDNMMEFLTSRFVNLNTAIFQIQKTVVNGTNFTFITNPDTGASSEILIVGQGFGGLKFGFCRYENDGITPVNTGEPYRFNNQFEVLGNLGATNGMCIGVLKNNAEIKFFQSNGGATQSARFTTLTNLLLGAQTNGDTGEKLQVKATGIALAGFYNTAGNKFFNIDPPNSLYEIGAPAAIGNGTRLSINDATQISTFTGMEAIDFASSSVATPHLRFTNSVVGGLDVVIFETGGAEQASLVAGAGFLQVGALNAHFFYTGTSAAPAYKMNLSPTGLSILNGATAAAQALDVNGSIITADPGAGKGAWQLGKFTAGVVALDAANYVEVKIDGTIRKLLVAA